MPRVALQFTVRFQHTHTTQYLGIYHAYNSCPHFQPKNKHNVEVLLKGERLNRCNCKHADGKNVPFPSSIRVVFIFRVGNQQSTT